MTSAPTRPAFAALEHEIAVFTRRARGASGALAREVHPGIDAAAYGLLVRIEELGHARVTDLADYFSVGKPTVSRQVTLLETLDLVARSRSDGDARSSDLTLTDRGRSQLAAARQARLASISTRLSGWSVDDVATLARLLGQLNRTMGP